MNSIKSFFVAIGHALGHLFSSHRAELLETLVVLAKPVVEGVSHVDWDGDGRVSAIGEIKGVALGEGKALFGELLGPGGELREDVLHALPTSTLKMWLGVARMAVTLSQAGHPIPALGRVQTAVQVAYEFLSDEKAQVPPGTTLPLGPQ